MEIIELGRISYEDAESKMVEILDRRIRQEIPDTLLLCEHEPVYTLGRRQGAIDNVICSNTVPVIQARRGGDVTYHGPGQLVGYPILELKGKRKDLHAYLHFLEQVWIDYLNTIGIMAGRDERNTGVWIDEKKLVAVGIACRRWVTWHGFACNVDLDLKPYASFNPCGMKSNLVTRLADHWNQPLSIDKLQSEIGTYFQVAWKQWNS